VPLDRLHRRTMRQTGADMSAKNDRRRRWAGLAVNVPQLLPSSRRGRTVRVLARLCMDAARFVWLSHR